MLSPRCERTRSVRSPRMSAQFRWRTAAPWNHVSFSPLPRGAWRAFLPTWDDFAKCATPWRRWLASSRPDEHKPIRRWERLARRNHRAVGADQCAEQVQREDLVPEEPGV